MHEADLAISPNNESFAHAGDLAASLDAQPDVQKLLLMALSEAEQPAKARLLLPEGPESPVQLEAIYHSFCSKGLDYISAIGTVVGCLLLVLCKNLVTKQICVVLHTPRRGLV